MGELLQQLPILKQYRAARPGGEAILIVGDRGAGGGGVIRTLFHGVSPFSSSLRTIQV
jgi:hypothetical protein